MTRLDLNFCEPNSRKVRHRAVLWLFIAYLQVAVIYVAYTFGKAVSEQDTHDAKEASSFMEPLVKQEVVACNNTGEHNTSSQGYIRQDVIYGHVHVAKTAGTAINGLFASHFERVCGNKGYSFDQYQYNERVRKLDGYVRIQNNRNPLYRSHKQRAQIGYEDCDFISWERPWKYWKQFSKWKMELHVPCREPIAHLMSQCNYKELTFQCNATDLKKEVNKCLFFQNHFSPKLEQLPNVSLRCFDPMPPSKYMNYMANKLQRRRIEADYVHLHSNRPRDKNSECIWNDTDTQAAVRKILHQEWDYYDYCKECMGSDKELVL